MYIYLYIHIDIICICNICLCMELVELGYGYDIHGSEAAIVGSYAGWQDAMKIVWVRNDCTAFDRTD